MTALTAGRPVRTLAGQRAGQGTVRFLAGSLPASSRPLLARMLVLLVLGAIVQGIAFALTVPIVENFFTPGQAVNWALLYGLIAAALVHAVMHHRSVPMGNQLGVDLATAVHRAIAEEAANAPAKRLDPAYAQRLAALDSRAVIVILGIPGHFLRPLIAAVLTPLTVVVIAVIVEPARGAVAAAGFALLAVICYVIVRLLAAAGEAPGTGDWLQRTAASAGSSSAGSSRAGSSRAGSSRAGSSRAGDSDARDAHAGAVSVAPGRPALLTVTGDVLIGRLAEIVLLAAVAAWILLWTRGDLSAGKTVALIVVSVLITRPLAEAVLLTSTIIKTRGVVSAIAELIGVAGPGGRPSDRPSDPARPAPAASWPASSDVEFVGVGVTEWGSPLLTGVSFAIAAKSTVTLAGGPDGARLALGDLLAGELDPSSGQVRIGGVDVAALPAGEVGAHVVRLAQSPPACTPADAASCVAALSRDGGPAGLSPAAAASLRLSLSRLADTVKQASDAPVLTVSDRWRLCLVRALARDPAVVIVDGDVSALAADPELADVAELLSALLADRTCLLLGTQQAGGESDRFLVADGASVRSR